MTALQVLQEGYTTPSIVRWPAPYWAPPAPFPSEPPIPLAFPRGRGPTAPQNPPLWDFAQKLDSE